MNIKQKLILILLGVGLIPMFVVESLAYVTVSNQLTNNAASELASIDIKQQQAISNLLQDKLEQVSQLANNYDFQVALSSYIAKSDAADLSNVTTSINSKQLSDPTNIQSVSIAKTDGKVIASTVSGTAGNQLPATLITKINGGNDNAIAVLQDPSSGLDTLNITTTIIVNNENAAIVDVAYNMSDLTAIVQDYTGLGQTGETIVADQDSQGHTISLFPLRFDTTAALHTNLDSLHLFANNTNTYSSIADYRSHMVTASARQVGLANWVIATKMDNSEIYAPSVKLRTTLFSLTAVSIALIIAIALYLALFFSRPILSIAETARKIGRGDLDARSDVTQGDEVGKLGASINAMGTNLSELVTRIETQRNQLQIILDNTTEGIAAVNKEGYIVIANKAAGELASLPGSDLVGKLFDRVFVWLKDGDPYPIDYRKEGSQTYRSLQYKDANGVLHYVRLVVSEVIGATKDEQTIITIHDETRSRELEDMKVDFVSMAAHELRTPLAAVRGYLELLRYKEADNLHNGGGQYITQALQSTKDLSGLINNLLDVTRIERGTLTLHMDEVDLAASVYHAVKDSEFVANEKHIALHYAGPEEGCSVVGDDVALREIINNLLSNAVKYTPSKGSINVDFTEQDGKYRISVQDTGSGIPKSALPNLFSKFYRVHGGLDSGSTGTGLGLFISKSIAERHHGTITVESDEGRGSTFTFIMPKSTDEDIAAIKQQKQSIDLVIRGHRGWVTQNIDR